LSGSTIAEDDDELDEDMHGDHAKLEAAVFSDEEKAKVNRKVGPNVVFVCLLLN